MLIIASTLLLLIGATLGEVCKDLNEHCNSWSMSGYCNVPTYHGFMSKHCLESCGICLQRCLALSCCEEKMRLFCANDVSEDMELFCCKPCRRVPELLEDAREGRCGIVDDTISTETTTQGFDTIHGTIPWQVYIPIDEEKDSFCGGVLISQRQVLTAAHCLYKRTPQVNRDGRRKLFEASDNNTTERIFDQSADSTFDMKPTDFYIYLGKHHRETVDGEELKVKVREVIPHHSYNHTNSDNDIAILSLDEEVQYTSHIRPICLVPTIDVDHFTGKARVSGWSNKEEEDTATNILQAIDVDIIDHDKCTYLLQNKSSEYESVTSNMVCAGNLDGGTDACGGDSGGPLSIDVNNQHFLIGLVSWGYGCGLINTPGVYAKISELLVWIIENETF